MRALCLFLLATSLFAATSSTDPRDSGSPVATVDLGTAAGASLVAGQWRFSPVKIVETEFPGPGADGQPTGPVGKTYDYTPHAGGSRFDDSSWEAIPPDSLSQRRSTGRLCFAWYRINVTIPASVDGIPTTGTTVAFETSVDDYAEVWVDGELSRELGQTGGSVIAGWNAGNRLIVARNAKPGQHIQLAVFGINGPLSNPPTNFIYMRYARLLFFRGETGPVVLTPREVNVEVIRKDPALDRIVGPNPKLYKVAEGFEFTEGPIWITDGGYLLFSDPNANTIYKYVPDGALSVYRHPSGYEGADIGEYHQPGSNGLTVDPQGRLVINQHGNRRVIRIEKNGTETTVADSFEGKRLNSPNDLVFRSDGTLFFTDPPFGLPKVFDDRRKELPFSGVYSVRDGHTKLLTSEFTGPNGIALSPDERYLYVGNWDDQKKVVVRYDLAADGSVSNRKLFFDMTAAPGEDAIDGIKVDQAGNVYVSGPGGIWILSPEGKHLGTIVAPKQPHNFNWGGADGRTLYLCAESALYRITLSIPGVRP